MEKVYAGKKGASWGEVTVNGKPLTCVGYHSDGFSWGYFGSGCAELALGILRNYFRENHITRDYILKMRLGQKMPKSLSLHQDFKAAFIASIRDDEWTITSEQIAEWVEAQPKEEVTN